MGTRRYYRGGPSLLARMNIDVRVDRTTMLLKGGRGVSVYDRPDHPNLIRLGGAYLLGELPEGLEIIQAGKRDLSHHEIVPARNLSLTFEDYQSLLDRIPLTPVGSFGPGE